MAHHSNMASRLQCSTCEKTYSRISHLRRHEATHGSHRLIVCPSCSKGFVRIDVARRHMRSCVDDQKDIVLPTAKRGKKPKACDRCSQSKVSCDLETPCTRCRSSGFPCSYLRVDAHTVTHAGPGSAKTEIPWLLRLTNPNAFGTEDAVSHDILTDDLVVEEPSNMLLPLEMDGTKPLPQGDMFPWGPAAWMIDDENFTLDIDGMNTDQSTFHSPALKVRMEEMIAELAKTHDKMRRDELVDDTPFEASLAHTVFTTHNLEHFIWVYFRRVHPYHPILHPPSFHCEQVSLPLLLCVFLYGALFSTPLDDAISARGFFHTAEEYIYSRLEMRQLLTSGGNSPCTTTTIEVLQAALSMIIIQTSKNDAVVRRRIRFERFHKLNAAVRYTGAFAAKHRMEISEYTADTWDQFIEDELLIRLAHYTGMCNNFMVGLFNYPSQVYLCEMVGDMPSRRNLFEADTSQTFAALALLEPSGPRPLSLAKSVSMLMHDSWPGPTDEVYKRATPEDLLIVMSSIGTTIVVSRTNCLFPASSRALLLACLRWKTLWDAATSNAQKPGFTKHGMEMWWLSVAIIKVQQAGDMSSDYMSKVALDSMTSVNEFLNRYKDAPNGNASL
ncbi:hypothetical protein B0T10DRAFT_479287 [Thelonectria olida]|uniref:Uncharacterized protein n=1 Tax=Thelonectria olida TaxID=1576542 RepID=A0A9P9AWN8_9HYPO|nr:hypothetical protein B0T10DRAFT_479287 [Thelonectria olida]